MHRHVPFCVGLVGLLVLIQSAAAQCMPGDRPFGQNLCLTTPPMVDRQHVGGCRSGEIVNDWGLQQDLKSPEMVCSIPIDISEPKLPPCPAGYSTLRRYCYHHPGMVTVRGPAECLPGQHGSGRMGCVYDPSAVASAGCAPGESTNGGLCYYFANETLVTQRGECQSGEQIVGTDSCRRQNGGGEYTPPQVQVPRFTCQGHDLRDPRGFCAYRPGQPR